MLPIAHLVAFLAMLAAGAVCVWGLYRHQTDRCLMLDVTDFEVSLTYAVPVLETTETAEGALCVDVDLLSKVLASCKGDITLRQTGPSEIILERQGGARTTLKALPADDFPTLPTVDANVLILPGKSFFQAVKRIIPAVSSEDSRFQLAGALFQPDDDGHRLHLVATDGHRLHHDEVTLDRDNVGHEAHIVPRLALTWLDKLPLALQPNTARWTHSDSHGQIYGPKWCLTYRIPDGAFPDWRRVINPPGNLVEPSRIKGGKPTVTPELTLEFEPDHLADALCAVTATTGNRARAVRATLNGAIELETNNPDTGRSTARAEIIDSNGRELTIGLNPDYLTDICRVAPTHLKVSAWSENHQAVFRSGDFEAVVMPIRL